MRVEILRECNTSRGYALPGPKHPEFSDVEAQRLIDQGHAREWVEPGEKRKPAASTKKRATQKKRAPRKAAAT